MIASSPTFLGYTHMIAYFKALFRNPTPLELITQELAEAHLAKLVAQTAGEYADSVVAYNVARIKRLDALMAHYVKTTQA